MIASRGSRFAVSAAPPAASPSASPARRLARFRGAGGQALAAGQQHQGDHDRDRDRHAGNHRPGRTRARCGQLRRPAEQGNGQRRDRSLLADLGAEEHDDRRGEQGQGEQDPEGLGPPREGQPNELFSIQLAAPGTDRENHDGDGDERDAFADGQGDGQGGAGDARGREVRHGRERAAGPEADDRDREQQGDRRDPPDSPGQAGRRGWRRWRRGQRRGQRRGLRRG